MSSSRFGTLDRQSLALEKLLETESQHDVKKKKNTQFLHIYSMQILTKALT